MNTKKIIEYRNLLGVTKTASLKELKQSIEIAWKEDHPDTIADLDLRLAAEERSKNIIGSLSFLVSIAPETQEKVKQEYIKTTSNSAILDFYMDNGVLYINFLDGNNFGIFGVPKNVYIKMINAESPARFARRHIYNEYLYRSANKLVTTE